MGGSSSNSGPRAHFDPTTTNHELIFKSNKKNIIGTEIGKTKKGQKENKK